MDLSNVQLPPPGNWQDFERLSRDLYAALWRDPHAQRNGRQGQPQHGVDIYGRWGESYAGVQCKGKEMHFGGSVTPAELEEEVEKARSFSPRIEWFTLVTTARSDQNIQQHARQLTERHKKLGLFGVEVMSWDEVQARLAHFPDVVRTHYPQFFQVSRAPAIYGEDTTVFGGSQSDWILQRGADCFGQSTVYIGTELPEHGTFEVAVVIPNVSDYVADRRFLRLVTNRGTNRWSGWSLWMNSQTLCAHEVQPYVNDDAWEARIILSNSAPNWTYNVIEFWRAWPLGRFYQRRALWEDGFMPPVQLPEAPGTNAPGRYLDPVLQILHVAEALEAGIRLANVLQKGPTPEKIHFGFRWSGLRNRVLLSRLCSGRFSFDRLQCVTDSIPGHCYIHASADLHQIPRFTHDVTGRLFRGFTGFTFDTIEVERLVEEFFDGSR